MHFCKVNSGLILLIWKSAYRVLAVFFFFKQKTAYELRISDWSSDVCSSGLHRQHADRRGRQARPDRGVAEVSLQPQRDDQRDGEERGVREYQRDRAGGEVAVPEKAQVNDRILVGELPDERSAESRVGKGWMSQ